MREAGVSIRGKKVKRAPTPPRYPVRTGRMRQSFDTGALVLRSGSVKIIQLEKAECSSCGAPGYCGALCEYCGT